MSKRISILFFSIAILLLSANFMSCSKDSPSSAPAPTDPCAGKTVTVAATSTIANCTNNGTITITAAGSTGFTYKLNAGGAYQASNIFNNLAAGSYTVFAKDVGGCEKSAAVTVASTTPVNVTATSTPAVNCVNDGTITVTATGGTGFTYKLNAGGTYQASNVFTGLATGSYTVFAKEAGGCEATTNVSVGASNSITVSATTTAATNCQTNGTITITASGSTGFTYKLNSGSYQASNVFNNLASGAYTAFAKDGAGCENSVAVSVTVNNTIAVNNNVVAASKCSNNGVVTVNASGSTGFTYKLGTGGTYQASNIFSALAAGSYTMFAKDGFGCENSTAATVSTNNTAGPLFGNVKNLLAAKCVSCHSGPSPAGGRDWTLDCEIVNFSDRINIRAVVIGDMPQGGPSLSAAEKAIITNWISAGAKFTD